MRELPTLKSAIIDKFCVYTTIIIPIDIFFENNTTHRWWNSLANICIFKFSDTTLLMFSFTIDQPKDIVMKNEAMKAINGRTI